MKNILKRIKEEKDFRFDFIICIWSAIIIIAIILVIIFGVTYAVKKGGNLHDAVNVSENTAQPSDSPSETPSATPSVIPTDQPDDEDGYDEDINEDSNLDDSENNETDDADNNESSETKVYATTNVNVRSEASTTASSLGKLSSGQSVIRIEQLANGWSKIKYNGKEAYVKSDFLTTNAFVATKAPVTMKPNSNKTPTATPKASNNKKTVKATKTPAKSDESDESVTTKKPVAPVTQAPTKDSDKLDIPIVATSEPAISSAATSSAATSAPTTTANSAAPDGKNQ